MSEPAPAPRSSCACSDDDLLAEAFAALSKEGTSDTKRKARTADIEDEIQPSELEAWSTWPTPLDEWRVQDVLSDMAEWEKMWLIFEVMLIEPGWMDDAAKGYPQSLLDGQWYDSIPPPGNEEQDTWTSRMTITVEKERWLLILAQVEILPSDNRDSFLLNLALVWYPFGQYLYRWAHEQEVAKDGFEASGEEYVTVDVDRVRWIKAFKKQHASRRAEIKKSVADGRVGVEAEAEAWNVRWARGDLSKGEGEVECSKIIQAGILAHRPLHASTLDKSQAQELLAFQVETTVLSLLDHPHLKLRQLFQLCLILTRAPKPRPQREVMIKLRDKIQAASEEMDRVELEWLTVVPGFAWDLMQLRAGLKAIGVEADSILPWLTL